jgi:hypothetical protein
MPFAKLSKKSGNAINKREKFARKSQIFTSEAWKFLEVVVYLQEIHRKRL